MFDPTTTINHHADWMLQSVTKSTSYQRAQALDEHGDEHNGVTWGERTTENADFTLGGTYAANGKITPPDLANGVIEWTLTYSETEFPKLSVSKDSAAGGATWAWSKAGFDLPARTIGCPSSIGGLTATGGLKTVVIACSCQHVEETDGDGEYGTIKGMRDVTITVTFTGVNGKPSVSAASNSGWDCTSDTETNSNTAVASGSVTYVKHFSVYEDEEEET